MNFHERFSSSQEKRSSMMSRIRKLGPTIACGIALLGGCHAIVERTTVSFGQRPLNSRYSVTTFSAFNSEHTFGCGGAVIVEGNNQIFSPGREVLPYVPGVGVACIVDGWTGSTFVPFE